MRIWVGVSLLSLAGLPACTRSPVAQQPAADAAVSLSSSAAASTAATQTTPAASNSVQAFIDPVTGELRAPTAAELATIQRNRVQATAATSSSSSSVTVTALPNGVTQYEFGSQSDVHETVCVQADGSLGECSAQQQAELRALEQRSTSKQTRPSKP